MDSLSSLDCYLDHPEGEFNSGLFDYHAELLKLARRLTRTFALTLHLPEDVFDQYIKRPDAGMRVLHYPAQTRSRDDQQGIGAHTDVECFTIVTQDDAGGLEVLNKKGHWVKAKPIPGSFVVNIADCFQRQMNDFFVSTVHRVINESGKECYSAPLFLGLRSEQSVGPRANLHRRTEPHEVSGHDCRRVLRLEDQQAEKLRAAECCTCKHVVV